MRLIRTIFLGATALAVASAPLLAQGLPAVGPATPTTPFTQAPTAATPAAAAPAAAPGPVIAAATPPAVDSSGIAAAVNDVSISEYELEQRVNFFIAINGGGARPNAEELKRLRAQVLQTLEDEKIQLSEARRRKITVSPVEIEKRIDDFVKDNNSTREQLVSALAEAGASIETLRNQYQAAEAWRKVIQSEFQTDVVVTQSQIDDAYRRAVEGANKTHFHVSEIFLPVDRPEDEAKVKATIEDAEKRLRNGGRFANIARQFSRNPSAAAGGNIGWVYDGQLDPELNKVLVGLKTGELSKPFRAKGGWYLLAVQNRQEALGTDVNAVEAPQPVGPPGTLPLARLTLPMPPGTTQEQLDNVMKTAMQVRQAAEDCAGLEKIAQEYLKGSVYRNLGNFPVTDLHPELKKALDATKSGEVAMPVLLETGVEIFMRCDRRAAPPREVFKLPTREEISDQLFQEQISALIRRYLRDLKREASIERPADNPVIDAALVK